MHKHILFLFFAFCSSGLFAQTHQLGGAKLNVTPTTALNSRLEHYSIFQMDVDEILRMASSSTGSLSLQLDFEGFPAVQAQLNRSSGLSANLAQTVVCSFTGQSDEKAEGEVALTFSKDLIYGLFETKGNTYFIEPLWYFDAAQPRNLFVVYNSSDVLEGGALDCSPIEVTVEQGLLEQQAASMGDASACKPLELEIAVANDLKMFTKYGSVDAVKAHNIAVLNASQINWDHDFSVPIIFKIATIFVPTTAAADPISQTETNRDNIMAAFRTWAENGGFGSNIAYDLGQWRSTRNIFGPNGQINGASYQTALPNGTGGPSVCTSLRYSIYSEREALVACELKRITSHETGHIFGASHVSGPINIMLTSSAGCTNDWLPSSKQQINSAIAGATCLSPAPCTIPGSVPLPAVFANMCTGFQECYTFDAQYCISTYAVYTTDPGLQITVTGRTVCITSVVYGPRTAYVWIAPLDHCGLPGAAQQGDRWATITIDEGDCDGYRANGSNVEGADTFGEVADRDNAAGVGVKQSFLFSNPSVGVVHLFNRIKAGDIYLYSMQGSLLKSFKMNNTNELDISDIVPGQYMLTLKTPTAVVSKLLTVFNQ